MKGPSVTQIQAIKNTGTVIVTGGVQKEVTRSVLQQIVMTISRSLKGSVSMEKFREGLHSCQSCERYALQPII